LPYSNIQLRGCKFSNDGVATWMLQKTVNIHEIIGLPYWLDTRNEAIVRYYEDVDAVFISLSGN
jgi:hypothetical protein